MIEIMCRDGKISSKELEKVADMIFYSTGIETEVVYEEDRRALVFWGPEDVKEIVESLNLKSIPQQSAAALRHRPLIVQLASANPCQETLVLRSGTKVTRQVA